MWKKREAPQTISNQVQSQPELLPVIRTMPQPSKLPPNQKFEENEKVVKEEWKVVQELPMQPIREIKREDGSILHLITIDEALNLLLND